MVKLKVPAEYDYETEEDPQLISEEKTLTCRLNEFKDSIIQCMLGIWNREFPCLLIAHLRNICAGNTLSIVIRVKTPLFLLAKPVALCLPS